MKPAASTRYPDVVLGVLIAYSPVWTARLTRPIYRPSGNDRFWFAMARNWAATILIVLFVLYRERRTLRSIGLTPLVPRNLAIAAGMWLLLTPLSFFLAAVTGAPANAGVRTILALPFGQKLALVITAAITEEVLFRAYPFERLAELFRSPVVAALLTYAVFVATHIQFFGLAFVLRGTVVGAVGLTVLYAWRRDLGANILLHFLSDAPILFVR